MTWFGTQWYCNAWDSLFRLTKWNFTALCYWLFVRVIHHWLMYSSHKRPVMCEACPCDNIIMLCNKCLLHQGASRAHKGSLVIALSKYFWLNLTIRMTYGQTAIKRYRYKFSYLSHLITGQFILYKQTSCNFLGRARKGMFYFSWNLVHALSDVMIMKC